MTDAADVSKLKLLRNPRIWHRGMRSNESGDGGFASVGLSLFPPREKRKAASGRRTP
jgi:hypothetical protein